MVDAVFVGLTAFLAPTVPASARAAWSKNGGVLATQEDASSANRSINVFVGVKGVEDVLVDRLRRLGFEVVDLRWVWDSLHEGRLLEKGAYSFDKQSEPAGPAYDPASSPYTSSVEPLKRKAFATTPSTRLPLDCLTAPSFPTAKHGSFILDDPRIKQLQRDSSQSPSLVPPTAPNASQTSISSAGENQEVAAFLLPPRFQPVPAEKIGGPCSSLATEEAMPTFEPARVKRESSGLFAAEPVHSPPPSFDSRSPPDQPDQPYRPSSLPFERSRSSGQGPHPPSVQLRPPALASLELAEMFANVSQASVSSISSSLGVVPASEVLSALRKGKTSSSMAQVEACATDQASVRSGLQEMHHNNGGFSVRRS